MRSQLNFVPNLRKRELKHPLNGLRRMAAAWVLVGAALSGASTAHAQDMLQQMENRTSMTIEVPELQNDGYRPKLDMALNILTGYSGSPLINEASASKVPHVVDGRVGIHVLFQKNENIVAAKAALALLGFESIGEGLRTVDGWLPVSNLAALSTVAEIHFVRALTPPKANFGITPNQADISMRSNETRNRFALDGKGIKIGIISSNYEFTEGRPAATASVLAGDLPGPGNPNGYTTPVKLVQEGTPGLFPRSNLDEARGMAEVVHDIVPAAELVVAGLKAGGTRGLINAIELLEAEGVDIIVDDINIPVAPAFQDDVAAQKIDEVTASGITYITSAGNFGTNQFYQIPYEAGDFFNAAQFETFDFNSSPTSFRPFFVIQPEQGETTFSFELAFQWDEPWASVCGDCEGAK
ncbi:MAG: hypothetical protein AAFV29_09765, partial [Myxococcota bacterium]